MGGSVELASNPASNVMVNATISVPQNIWSIVQFWATAAQPPDDASCIQTPFGCAQNFSCSAAWGLEDAGFGYCTLTRWPSFVVNLQTALPWEHSHGSAAEQTGAHAAQWIAFAMCVIMLGLYAYHAWKATTGWEEVYVCIVELCKVLLELYHEFDPPATLYLSTGNQVLWLRYGEWLLTCPVILIHLSNITGMKNDYSKRTMTLLVSDIGCIVWGITAAISIGYIKWIFFFLGLCYGCNTYFHAAKVYVEAYHTVPKGHCRMVVKVMAYVFYVGWTMFPLLFVFGPEGFGHLSGYGSTIAHTVADILSKQLWTVLGHHLRVKIHEHILIHGNITTTVKLQVAGEEMEVQQMVEEEGEDTVKHSTKDLASRESFLVMRDNLKAQGYDIRASLDSSMPADGKPPGLGSALEPGRVILAVPDISMVDYFRMQFAQLPAPIELVPALGMDNSLQLVQQAMQLGGLDFVLVHPEFLKDKSPSGLVNRLKMFGHRVCAFGWVPAGPVRELIETSNLDGYLEGPSFGTGINLQQLMQLIAKIQTLRKQAMMGGMGMGMGMPGMMGGGFANPAAGFMGANIMGAANSFGQMTLSGGGAVGYAAPTAQQPSPATLMPQQSSGGRMSNPQLGTNPLFGAPPSPLGSQYNGGQPTTAGSATPPTPTGAGLNEAEMLQQLMSEISRLKNELGENN